MDLDIVNFVFGEDLEIIESIVAIFGEPLAIISDKHEVELAWYSGRKILQISIYKRDDLPIWFEKSAYFSEDELDGVIELEAGEVGREMSLMELKGWLEDED